MKFRSVRQIEQYLLAADSRRRNHYTLERMVQAVQVLGNPQLKYKVVHVGGTSGKGSTCQITAAILQASGARVGLFTSPAIVSPLERLQINGRPVTERNFVTLTNSVWPILRPIKLTYFEFFTIMALLYFAQRKVDYAVIEVGMGGRLDATNIVTPTVAIVTTIGLDHTKQLGRTRSLIAREKEQIIKPGCIGLTGSRFVKRGTFINTSSNTGKLRIHSQDLSGSSFSYKTSHKKYSHLQLNLVGEFQIHNAVLALEAAQRLGISSKAIRDGLRLAHNPGRFEIVQRTPLVIMDGAHNPEKMSAFTESLQAIVPISSYTTVVGLIALKYNKDATATLRPLIKQLDAVVITSFDKGMSLHQLRRIVRTLHSTCDIYIHKNNRQAFTKFQSLLTSNSLGIITGSLYMIGNLRAAKLV